MVGDYAGINRTPLAIASVYPFVLPLPREAMKLTALVLLGLSASLTASSPAAGDTPKDGQAVQGVDFSRDTPPCPLRQVLHLPRS